MEKLKSRKLWLAIAAFLVSVGTGISGIVVGNYDLTVAGAIMAVVGAGIYQACEAAVDAASVKSTTTTKSITATATDKVTVQQVLGTGASKEEVTE